MAETEGSRVVTKKSTDWWKPLENVQSNITVETILEDAEPLNRRRQVGVDSLVSTILCFCTT